MSKLAYKIVAVNRGMMVSPISYLGLAIVYRMGKWTKPQIGKYLFVYKSIKDAEKVFSMLKAVQRFQIPYPKCEVCNSGQHLVIIECETENLRKAVGGGPVPEYKCTRLKPIKVVE